MIKIIATTLFAIVSVIVFLEGLSIAIHTSGIVHGSEYQMLITLNSQFSYFLVWLASYAFYSIALNTQDKKATTAEKQD